MHSKIIPLLTLLSSGYSAMLNSGIGPYGTQITTRELTDFSRVDPYAPDQRKRRLMLSLITPIARHPECLNSSMEYMPALTANFYDQLYAPITTNGTFESFTLETCSKMQSSSNHRLPRDSQWRAAGAGANSRFPVVIFSPGYGNSRLLYTALCQSVASYGMNVITIDHPYDALGIEYPDGTYVLGTGNSTTDQELERDIAIRVADSKFVIDSVFNGDVLLPGTTGNALKQTEVFMFGQSLGGASSLTAMFEDPRIRAGANLDGRLFAGALPSGKKTKKPFLLVGNGYRNASTDATWDTVVREHLIRPVQEQIPGTEHGSFTDLPLLLEAAGTALEVLSGQENGVGTVKGSELVKILARMLVGFFEDSKNHRSP